MKIERVVIIVMMSGLLGLLLVAAAGCTPVENSPGRIELSEAEFDFGTVSNIEPVSEVFQVRNVGQGALEITGVSTSCGCTTADVDDRSLEPGEATNLTVVYDPRVHGGETGEFLRVVYLRSSDPDTP